MPFDVTSPTAHKRGLRLAALLFLVLATVIAFVLLREDGPGYQRLDGPARTVIRDGDGTAVAVLTDGARTVLFTGAERTFTEPATTTASVTTRAVVRLAPRPWHAGAADEEWFKRWFAAARASHDPDILDIAAQYLPSATQQRDSHGTRYAGPAAYGPMGEDDERRATADFNDYLGVDWDYPGGRHRKARSDFYGSVDCSGFVRMVYGYRSGYPLEFKPPTGRALPRRAVMMAEDGPGATVIANTHRQANDFGALQPGDLLFFNASPDAGPQIDHVGIYLGLDSTGRHRFVSSRKTANGPTLGDDGGASLLDGTGLYARAFRSAKRL
ncbi:MULTISPECIES: C40 family peptidase [unclassified Streptomyces]|uniref:C40 family peptidase n=1 Tax=unclassified Streptomyces TaxID=2593676 RepID=UPI0037FF20FC